MSLVSTFVESQEGHWYCNPVIRRDHWFICWDDDEPIELVIERGTRSLLSVLAELNKAGWDVAFLTTGVSAYRYFVSDFSEEARPAQSYFLKQRSNGPTDALLSGNERMKKKPTGQGVYYTNSRNGNGGFE